LLTETIILEKIEENPEIHQITQRLQRTHVGIIMTKPINDALAAAPTSPCSG
jgi:hypothetical protein